MLEVAEKFDAGYNSLNFSVKNWTGIIETC